MISRVFGLALAVLAFSQSASGQNLDAAKNENEYRDILNGSTVTLLAGAVTGAYVRMADDIATAISDVDDVRLSVMLGSGVNNVRDVLYMRGVDMGIIKGDSLETFKGKPFFENIAERLRYVVRLHNEEFHILAGPGIRSAKDLDGKVVAFHNDASLSSGGLLLNALGVKPRESIILNMFDAADKMKAGTVDGFVRLTGKPDPQFARVVKINPELRFVPVDFGSELLKKGYLPTQITPTDYPTMFKSGEGVDAVALGSVLAVYNWPADSERYKRLEKFVNAFFSRFDKLRQSKGRHPKWDEINLAGEIAGWKRFQPAQDWLDRARATGGSAASKNDSLRENFERFLAEKHGGTAFQDKATQERIFKEFLRWQAQPAQ